MTDVLPQQHTYRRLAPEPWGSRLRRAREAADLTLKDAAEAITPYWRTSAATLSRIENLVERPSDDQARLTLASIAALLYNVDPADVDIDVADIPRGAWEALSTPTTGHTERYAKPRRRHLTLCAIAA